MTDAKNKGSYSSRTYGCQMNDLIQRNAWPRRWARRATAGRHAEAADIDLAQYLPYPRRRPPKRSIPSSAASSRCATRTPTSRSAWRGRWPQAEGEEIHLRRQSDGRSSWWGRRTYHRLPAMNGRRWAAASARSTPSSLKRTLVSLTSQGFRRAGRGPTAFLDGAGSLRQVLFLLRWCPTRVDA